MVTRKEVTKLDKLVGRKVVERDGGCIWCHSQEGPWHPHHMISRRYRGVRWEPHNVVKICHRCHFKAHKDPLWNEDMAIKTVGEERYAELKRMAQMVKVSDYEAVKLLWTVGGAK
jgi:hypothetical protein